MIKNFEDITRELNEKELELIPILIGGLKFITKDRALKAHEIVAKINRSGPPVMLTEPRLRKCVNHIRTNGLLPLIATSDGYYVSYDKEVIKSQIESLQQRARSIQACAAGLDKFLHE